MEDPEVALTTRLRKGKERKGKWNEKGKERRRIGEVAENGSCGHYLVDGERSR